MNEKLEKAAVINKETPVTIGLVILVVGVSFGAIFKAGQVLTEMDYIKVGIADLRSEVAEMKRVLYRIDRQPRDAARQ